MFSKSMWHYFIMINDKQTLKINWKKAWRSEKRFWQSWVTICQQSILQWCQSNCSLMWEKHNSSQFLFIRFKIFSSGLLVVALLYSRWACGSYFWHHVKRIAFYNRNSSLLSIKSIVKRMKALKLFQNSIQSIVKSGKFGKNLLFSYFYLNL